MDDVSKRLKKTICEEKGKIENGGFQLVIGSVWRNGKII
jgi:hypothetical protein